MALFDLSTMMNIQNTSDENSGCTSASQDEEQSITMPLSFDGHSSIPRMESVSTFASDDVASASSCAGMSPNSIVPKRSIFSSYWSKHKRDIFPQQTRAAPPIPEPAPLWSKSQSDSVVYDSSSSSSDASPPSFPRRSILPTSYSYQSLPQTQRLARKSSSTSDLEGSSHHSRTLPSSSCLRSARFSPNRQRSVSVGDDQASTSGMSTSSSVVRFDLEAIDVMHFAPPQETYASSGWSDYFTG